MNAGTELLKPLLVSNGSKAVSKVVLSTVKGDLHDIGKNPVKMMMEGKGLEVIDVGIDVPADKFIQTIKDTGTQIIAMSALLDSKIRQLMVNP